MCVHLGWPLARGPSSTPDLLLDLIWVQPKYPYGHFEDKELLTWVMEGINFISHSVLTIMNM